jgi:hypothetical protein
MRHTSAVLTACLLIGRPAPFGWERCNKPNRLLHPNAACLRSCRLTRSLRLAHTKALCERCSQPRCQTKWKCLPGDPLHAESCRYWLPKMQKKCWLPNEPSSPCQVRHNPTTPILPGLITCHTHALSLSPLTSLQECAGRPCAGDGGGAQHVVARRGAAPRVRGARRRQAARAAAAAQGWGAPPARPRVCGHQGAAHGFVATRVRRMGLWPPRCGAWAKPSRGGALP